MQDTHKTPPAGEDSLRRDRKQIKDQADALIGAVENQNCSRLTFPAIHRTMPDMSGPGRQMIHAGLSEEEQAVAWDHVKHRSAARRYLDGDGPFTSAKPEPTPRPRLRVLPPPRTSRSRLSDEALHTLRTMPAEDYLPAIAGVEALPGGRCHCPLPQHNDSNPSATYKDNLWHCHACATGGDLITLASEVSGISTTGSDFFELARWIADRLMGRAAEVQDSLDRRAA